MILKVCKCCQLELPITEFYKHSQMEDGHLNFCKECVKVRVAEHRTENIEKIREYDRIRGKLAHRIKKSNEISNRRNRTVPGYMAAHNKLVRSVNKGLIVRPKKCCHCGNDKQVIEAHHEDYFKPLEVIWLCTTCHRLLHLGKSEKAKELQAKYKVPGR